MNDRENLKRASPLTWGRYVFASVAFSVLLTAYLYYAQNSPQNDQYAPGRAPKPPSPDLLVGFPLRGIAIHTVEYSLDMETRGTVEGAHSSGTCRFVVQNLNVDGKARTLHFPPLAVYSESGSNAYQTLDREAWPEFVKAPRTVTIPSGGTKSFSSRFNSLHAANPPWNGTDWIFVFGPPEDDPEIVGELYVGCLSFPGRLDSSEEAKEWLAKVPSVVATNAVTNAPPR